MSFFRKIRGFAVLGAVALLAAAPAAALLLAGPAIAQTGAMGPGEPAPPTVAPPSTPELTDAQKAAAGKALTDTIIAKSNAQTLFESIAYNDKRLAARHLASGVICPFQAGETNDITVDGDAVICHSTLDSFAIDLKVTIRPLVGKAKKAQKEAFHQFWDRIGDGQFIPTIKAGWPVFKKNELSFVQAGETLYILGKNDGRLHRFSVIVVNNWVIEFEASGNWKDAAGVALVCDIDWMDMVYGAAEKAYRAKQAQTGQSAPQPPS